MNRNGKPVKYLLRGVWQTPAGPFGKAVYGETFEGLSIYGQNWSRAGAVVYLEERGYVCGKWVNGKWVNRPSDATVS